MKIKVIDGIKWVEPYHVKISDLINRLKNHESVEAIKDELGITDNNHWNRIAKTIFEDWKLETEHPQGHDALVIEVNQSLAQYALSFPVLGTAPEARRILEMLHATPPQISDVTNVIYGIVMNPRVRAVQQAGRFTKIPLFKEFAYFIDSASIAYYRGNVAASFLCVIPVIEGIILRWQGFPGTLDKKPNFEKIKKFIGKSIERQPVPSIPTFFESYIQAADGILKNHLYRNSVEGDSHDDFNRHLALHMLDDKKFYSPDNVMRAFLLLDLLSEIYICEKHIVDMRWDTLPEEEQPYISAYQTAYQQGQVQGAPESILSKYERHIALRSLAGVGPIN